MYIIDVMVRYTSLSMSVQRKTVDEAEAVYREVLVAIQSGQPQVLELTCQQTDKRVAILSSEITAVQMAEKSGTPAGRTPGFFAVT